MVACTQLLRAIQPSRLPVGNLSEFVYPQPGAGTCNVALEAHPRAQVGDPVRHERVEGFLPRVTRSGLLHSVSSVGDRLGVRKTSQLGDGFVVEPLVD